MSVSPTSPHVSISRISIRGVDPGTAKSLGPAIERAIGDAVRDGRLAPGNRASLKLDLSHGATSRDIAKALARALERG